MKFNYKDRNDKSVTYSKNQTISIKYKSKQSEPVVEIVDLSCGQHDETIFGRIDPSLHVSTMKMETSSFRKQNGQRLSKTINQSNRSILTQTLRSK